MTRRLIFVVLITFIISGCSAALSPTREATPSATMHVTALPDDASPTAVVEPEPTALDEATLVPSPEPPPTNTSEPQPTATVDAGPLYDPAGLSIGPGGNFVPLDDPVFMLASQSTLGADEIVLGLGWNGEYRAYPVGMMAYHHIANDEVRGSPILITY